MESIDGTLSRVFTHRPPPWDMAGVPRIFGKLHNGATVSGPMLAPRVGESYRLYGSSVPSKNPRYPDPIFEFFSAEVLIDESEAGVATYLRNYVPGLGQVRAAALVEHFGAETLAILRTTPGRAAECPGITESIAAGIRQHFENDVRIDPAAYARLSDLLKPFRVPQKVVTQLVKDFGSAAYDLVADRPYSVLLAYPRMGWKTVDAVAIQGLKYPAGGPDRHAACLVECLEQLANQGHTYGERGDVEEIAFGLVGGLPTEEGWVHALADQRIAADTLDQRAEEFAERAAIDAGEGGETLSRETVAAQLGAVYFRPGVKFFLPKIGRAEEEVARRLVTLGAAADPLDVEIDARGLNADQARAVAIIPSHGVALVTGGPGTGKTYSIGRVLSGLARSGVGGIRMVAPTGKAAKRAAEVLAQHLPGCEIPCSTIHKALCPVPSGAEPGAPPSSSKVGRGREAFRFGRNEENPLDEQIVVIDETSMVDVQLAAALLRAIAPGTRVVFVGDANQLPSVGAGSVLRDMIDAGLPCATLTKIQRSESAGRVVHACHAIADGRLPVPAESVGLPVENWIHLEIGDQAEMAQQIADLIHGEYKAFPDPIWDIQVVTPQRAKHPTACANLNRLLSRKLNPPAPGTPEADEPNQAGETGEAEPMFRAGDKVVRNKNGLADLMVPCEDAAYEDWRWDGRGWAFEECEVVNGDMGTVRDVATGNGGRMHAVVEFRNPSRLVRLPMSEHHLSLAYAMTCHKAQGSGFPLVIVPVHGDFYWDDRTKTGVFNREWLYTAISRAEKLLVTVGQSEAIRAAVGRKTIHRRRTRLADLIRRERWQQAHDSGLEVGEPLPQLEGASA